MTYTVAEELSRVRFGDLLPGDMYVYTLEVDAVVYQKIPTVNLYQGGDVHEKMAVGVGTNALIKEADNSLVIRVKAREIVRFVPV